MLQLVSNSSGFEIPQGFLSCEDHQKLLESYWQSHRIRNHSPQTIAKQKTFLEGWFISHGREGEPLKTWEAMEPREGRRRIQDYSKVLLESGVSSDTIRSYLGHLNRYFSYVLEHPFIFTSKGTQRIQDIYGPIEHPISEYDRPAHAYDGERRGIPLEPEKLYNFYAHLRQHYLNQSESYAAIRARNYTMVVLAGETGLRIDELLHLEIRLDLFFESKKIQTRFAKGTRGSGKRARVTLFSPLARDTVKYYLKEHRPHILNSDQTDCLFLSKIGRRMDYSSAHEALEQMKEVSKKTHFPIADHFSWHWLRKIFATLFIEKFPNQLSVLLMLLGHENLSSVHRYIRHSEAWMDRQIQSVLERSE